MWECRGSFFFLEGGGVQGEGGVAGPKDGTWGVGEEGEGPAERYDGACPPATRSAAPCPGRATELETAGAW